MNKIEIGKKYRTRDGKPVRVLCTDLNSDNYPVVACIEENDNFKHVRFFTADGKFNAGTTHYYDLIEVITLYDFKIDEPVMVRDYGNKDWHRRYFSGVVEGKASAWSCGSTRWSSGGDKVRWDECRRPTPEELGNE